MLRKIKSKLNQDSNLKELVSGSFVTFILKMTGMGLSYVFILALSKKNGADGAGYYYLTNNTLLLCAMLVCAGTNISILRYVGQFNNKDEEGKLHPLYRVIVKIIVPLSLILGAALILLSSWISSAILDTPEFSNALIAIGITLPFFAMDVIAVEFIRGLKKLKISEFFRSVMNPVVILTLLIIYWSQVIPDIYIVYFFCGAIIAKSILSSSYVILHLSRIKKASSDLITSDLNTKEVLKTSSPMMISSVSAVLMSSVPIFFLEYFESTKTVGIYGTTAGLSLFISIILIVVNTIAAPKFSELFWAKKMDELQTVLVQSVKIMFWTALALGILIAVFAEPILRMFGEAFVEGRIALFILIGGQIFNAATGSVGLFLNMSGNQKVLQNTAVISLVFQTILTLILTPNMGMLGAALASLIGGIIWNILCILYVQKKMNLRTYYFPFIR